MNIVRVITAASMMALIMTLGFVDGVNAEGSGKCGLYEYRADVRRVIEGDTVVEPPRDCRRVHVCLCPRAAEEIFVQRQV